MNLHNQEEQGFLTGLRIPAPWSSGKTIESIHPVRDNYKFKETVHIPGARCLYLRFDTRCSSQYDYDKVNNVLKLTFFSSLKLVEIFDSILDICKYNLKNFWQIGLDHKQYSKLQKQTAK